MKKHNGHFFIISCILTIVLNACHSKKSPDTSFISTDSATIAQGENKFTESCSACHSFNHDAIGPGLGGVTTEVSADWLRLFIKDPKAVIESGDARAQKLFARYKTYMPSFAHYSDEEIDGIVAFLHTKRAPKRTVAAADDKDALKDPIPQRIEASNIVVEMKLVTQIPASDSNRLRTRITKLYPHPNTGELFVLDLRGKLYRLNGNQPDVYIDMGVVIPKFIHKPGHATGFGSFAFHPEFNRNGLLYTTHTEPAGSAKADFSYPDSMKVTLQWVLLEWKADQPGAFPFSGKRRELFRVNMVNQTHGVQEIVFNPLAKRGDKDYGMLYIGIGDGGSAESRHRFLTRSLDKIWGTIIRIDPSGRNSANAQYGIPEDNPFSKKEDATILKEIYAYGFRNPHRITWSNSGALLSSNIGQHSIEALNIVLPGRDYGWPIREGTFLLNPAENFHAIYPLPSDDSTYNITYPVAQYDHDEGNAIIGGFEYVGKATPALKGKYLFGDMVNGRLFYVEMKDLKVGSQAVIREWFVSLNGKPTSFAQLCGEGRLSLRFGRDKDGEIYLFAMVDGKVYKLVAEGNSAEY